MADELNKTIDRPIKDIIQSIMRTVNDKKVTGQLARDLEKLCAYAARIEE